MAKILIIEDEEMIRKLLKRVFKLVRKEEVVEAAKGMDGVDTAVKEKPEFIFCDIGLPDISGIEVIRQLRNNKAFENTRIIAMSAEYENENKALEAGADSFLKKPFFISDIEKAIGS